MRCISCLMPATCIWQVRLSIASGILAVCAFEHPGEFRYHVELVAGFRGVRRAFAVVQFPAGNLGQFQEEFVNRFAGFGMLYGWL